jgi:hypothetical protein
MVHPFVYKCLENVRNKETFLYVSRKMKTQVVDPHRFSQLPIEEIYICLTLTPAHIMHGCNFFLARLDDMGACFLEEG